MKPQNNMSTCSQVWTETGKLKNKVGVFFIKWHAVHKRHYIETHPHTRACVCKHIQICASRKDNVLAMSVKKDSKYCPPVSGRQNNSRFAAEVCWNVVRGAFTYMLKQQPHMLLAEPASFWLILHKCLEAWVSYLPSTLHYQSCCQNHSTLVSIYSVKINTYREWWGQKWGGGSKVKRDWGRRRQNRPVS